MRERVRLQRVGLVLSAVYLCVAASCGKLHNVKEVDSPAKVLGLSEAEYALWQDPRHQEDREQVAERLQLSKTLIGKTRTEAIFLLGKPQAENRGPAFELNYVIGVVALDYLWMDLVLERDRIVAVRTTMD